MIVVVLSILPISRCIDANSIPTRPGVHTCQQALLPPSCNQPPPPLQHTRTQTAQDHIENDFTPSTTSTYKQLYKQSSIFQVLSDETVTKPGLTLSSSKNCSHFADMTCPPRHQPPWGKNVGLLEICIIFTLLPPGHQCFTNTCLVFILIKAFMMHIFH